jgi:hypothetical protein
MARPLPFPGYSWPFTQHAIAISPGTTYDLLKCAAPFEGFAGDYASGITQLMIAANILTKNVRDGQASPWRDYQQVLPELGLIYSTTVSKTLILTELAQQFLAGEITFPELITSQSLRYQYPNGQKSTIQTRQRTELEAAGLPVPDSYIELLQINGVLVKPGALILRVLLELQRQKHIAKVSVSECLAFLLPCKRNADWPYAFAEIVQSRSENSANLDLYHRHARRNIQDWFKFLGKSIFFYNAEDWIGLSVHALNNLAAVDQACAVEEEVTSFWVAPSSDQAGRSNWFEWFGHIPLDSQAKQPADTSDETEDVVNHIAVGEETTTEARSLLMGDGGISLQPIDIDHLGRNPEFMFAGDITALIEGLRNGAERRHAKTLLHDRIVRDLAERFARQGATLQSDPNSIDLHSTWPDGSSALFEVKTVTKASLQGRLRTAVGQIQEYAYRRVLHGAPKSDRIVVINSELTAAEWQTTFLVDHLKIGLICRTSTRMTSFAPSDMNSRRYWS